ncbi:5698_t:CDS:2, partial [Dentiscutata erythropus]
ELVVNNNPLYELAVNYSALYYSNQPTFGTLYSNQPGFNIHNEPEFNIHNDVVYEIDHSEHPEHINNSMISLEATLEAIPHVIFTDANPTLIAAIWDKFSTTHAL